MNRLRLRICRTCNVEKPLRLFYRAGGKRRRTECRDCTLAYAREAYELKRFIVSERARRYRASAHGQAVIRAYRRSEGGRERQRESQRIARGWQRVGAQA